MIRKVVVYFVVVIANYLMYSFLDICGALKIFTNDIVKHINIYVFLVLLGVTIILFGIWVIIEKEISDLHILIIKYKYTIYVCMFILGVFFWKKNSLNQNYIASTILAIELLGLYILIEYESTKLFAYKFETNKKIVSNYTEKPVVGRTILTKTQIKALDQLLCVLDERKMADSFNIALIGAWGSGKTSITDTLISELQMRKKDEKRYFILKISAQTFNGTQNIIDYVKRYIHTLFKKYGIGGMEKQSDMVFLSALSNMIGGTGVTAVLSGIFDKREEELFSDLENERTMFSQRIQLLLKKSGRKNIVFIIDDADRSETEKDVLNLLTEFSSINGLISIVLLDKKYDVILKPEGNKEAIGRNQNEEYNAIDKYVHIRVRIETNYHVEYEQSIKKQIILENTNIKRNENCYIVCSENNEKLSIFSPVRDYQTNIRIENKHIISDVYANLLTDIFLKNLENSDEGFGKYLEDVVMEYVFNSKELWPHVVKLLTIKPENWDNKLWQIKVNWTDNGLHDERFDWTMRIRNNASQYFFILYNLLEAIGLVREKEINVKDEIGDLGDLYDFYMISESPMTDRTWENRKENVVIYAGFDEFIQMVFSDEEITNINKLLYEKEYEEIKSKILEKLLSVGNLFISVTMLVDFIEYMRKIMNNYRTFKMQLREAEMLGINYLDYLVKEWQPTAKVVDQIEELKKGNPEIKDIQLNIPSLSSFINMIFYSRYVTQYGKRFVNNELEDYRLWVFRECNSDYLVLSKNIDGNYSNIVLDISGEIIANLPGNIQNKINENAKEICR